MQTKSANLLAQLVNKLIHNGSIKSPEVKEVMLSVDRGEFCEYDPYVDSPQKIGYNATISAPHMHAYSLELLKDHLSKAEKILDVGSGSGYLLAAFHKMNPKGVVVGIEHMHELVKKSELNLNKSFQKELESGKIKIVEGDGRKGFPDEAPYDCIHVGAAAAELPQALLDQLKKGGRMIIPVGTEDQKFQVIDKDLQGKLHIQNILGVRYVPLTSKENQWNS